MIRMEMHATIQIEARLIISYLYSFPFVPLQPEGRGGFVAWYHLQVFLGEKEQELNAFGGEVEGVHVPWTRLWRQ